MDIRVIIPKQKTQDTIVFHHSLFSNDDKLILAPMQNLTSLFFRKTFSEFFPQNIDYAISPFISVSSNCQSPSSIIYNDIRPLENENTIPLVPQILGNNVEQILECAKIIESLGYREINLNMGCPKRDIVSRDRGAGLLRDKDLIHSIFDAIFNNTKLQLSIKVRLGISDETELSNLVPILNIYPLKSICIHPRTQKQQYDGQVNLSLFEHFARELKHTVIYNGDIFTVDDFTKLKTQFPYVKHWMIGRGVLMNPFLCADIRGIPYNKSEMLIPYLKKLQDNFIKYLPNANEIAILGKMKEFTKYLSLGCNVDVRELLRECSLEKFNHRFYKIFNSD